MNMHQGLVLGGSDAAQGGGGWYGGGAGGDSTGGGGGSGWVYTESTYNYWKNNSTEGKSNKWILNSSYYLTNASTSTSTHTGNGQARITPIN